MLFNLSGLSVDLQQQIASNPKLSSMFSRFPDELLSVDSNAKTVKGQKLGVKTAILYLAPFNLSGVNLCPMAEKAGCVDACLFSAGRGKFKSVFFARLRKTLYFHQYKKQFIAQLLKEISALKVKSIRNGFDLHVRLNGTADIVWEVKHPEIFEQNPTVQFYDYTKIAGRKAPKNYDLTFSFSQKIEFKKSVNKAIKSGDRIAVVFRKKSDIPESYLGLTVVDGDDTDVRAFDPLGVVVALYAKGSAKNDYSGFVV